MTALGLRVPTTFRAWRRLATFGALLAVLGMSVPDAGHPDAQFALIKLDQVEGVDATDNVVWILALGSDARPGQPVLGSRSDAIQLVGINTKTHHAVTIGVPRDSWVEIPGVGMSKINAAMVYGGAQGMASAVANLIGIQPDYVFVTSFRGLIRMVGGIHGVRAKVTYEMDDQGVVFHPGMHLFSGVEALKFARIRHGIPGGDFDRSMDQGQLLKGGLATLKGKMDRPGFFERALGLLARYTDTNVNPVDMYRLGRDVLEVNATNVQTCVLEGGTGTAGGGQSVVFPNISSTQALASDVRHDATVDHGCSR
jgi:polyisoprenyl-teichoic acid--peptidoglycan teichoic acid transferase